ncbi:MAG: mechanosensitive ion channel family protein [Treponema sp.]|nr:mechanosensitive ion channel family protein [Treponema sp.]
MLEQFKNFLGDYGIAAGIIIGQIVAIVVIWLVAKALSKWISGHATERFKPLTIKKLKILTPKQISQIILGLIRILKYVITLFQLFITVPIIFSLFPQTEELADTIFGYIITPLKNIALGFVSYIPNLITIIIILIVTRYILRGLKFFARQIAIEKMKIPRFHADWANPTFNILRFLIYAFNVAIIFPYLPGSQSMAFQGVSVFVGIIFSLGSSTAIGNLVAGLVITYMRSFKIGDRIQIQGNTGFVVEKSMMVLRIKTQKNEYITFPNLQVLSASIINYNTSSDEDEEGLVLNADITCSYATPWRTIHEILIEAALNTSNIQKNPKPFVLQLALDDNYVRYQINCFTKQIAKIPAIYTELFENIQDGFAARGMDMTTPQFRIIMPPDAKNQEIPVTDAADKADEEKKGKRKKADEPVS